ncbi:hypothetical protein EMCRGX_G014841 [Ephydatia muelleri]
MAGKLALLVEFLTSLAKIAWYITIGIFKLFAPIKKKDVKNEIVLVTGAGSGIGRLIALRFSELGAKVILWDINKKAIDVLAEEIVQKGQQAFAFECDLMVVNNAGIVSGKKLDEVSDASVLLTMEVNTMAHFWVLKAFLPSMITNNHGYIITIASSAGLFGVAGLVDYCASKYGAVGIHEALAGEISVRKCDGIHTTCVCPYFIDTGMFEGVKTRIPFLLPILTPEYAVDKIMNAFHSNQYMLMMPRVLYLFYILQSILPKAAMLEAGNFFGVDKYMNTFVAIKWWILQRALKCAPCPSSALDHLSHPANMVEKLTLAKTGLVETCRRAHIGVQVEVGNNLTLDHSKSHLADFLLHNWFLGKTVALDVSITTHQ